jgi:succinate dehydrogenase/fumarate reductase flavoprotein subunit
MSDRKDENLSKQGDERDKRMDRRGFLGFASKGAIAGAAVAATQMIGCGDTSESNNGTTPDTEWDEETDFIVVGAGTGLTGALKAASDGNEVIVFEKADLVGGSTAISGGWAWIPNNPVMQAEGITDSPEMAKTYLTKLAYGQADEAIIDRFIEKGPEMVSYVEQNSGVTWGIAYGLFESEDPCTEYHPEWEGGVKVGRSLAPLSDGQVGFGGTLIQGLLSGAEGAGAQIRTSAPVEKLLTRQLDDGRQEVLGVVVTENGTKKNVKARKGVLLAAGGFDWDFEMKRQFLRGPTPYATGVSTLTGDGIKMAMAVGAQTESMNEAWGMPVYREQAQQANESGNPAPLSLLLEKSKPGAIFVNKYGERFCNEASDYDTLWRSFFAWENWGDTGYRNIPAYVIYDSTVREQYTIAGKSAGDALPGWVIEGSSIAEIAGAMGIDAQKLQATIDEFNTNAENLEDPHFHRGESAYDRAWSTGMSGPEATLGPIDQPPFYIAEVGVSDIGTSGGAKANVNAQVMTPFGEPIPRLYVCGNNSGIGGPGAGYGGGGGTIGPAMTWAYIAGEHVSTLEPWEE